MANIRPEDVKDELDSFSETLKNSELYSKLNLLAPIHTGGFKRGEMLIIASGPNKGRSTFWERTKARPDGNSEYIIDFEAHVFKELGWTPGSADQQLGRIAQRRTLVNALLLRECLSRNQREGRYAFKKKKARKVGGVNVVIKRHTRKGPLSPKVVQLAMGKAFDKLLVDKFNQGVANAKSH